MINKNNNNHSAAADVLATFRLDKKLKKTPQSNPEMLMLLQWEPTLKKITFPFIRFVTSTETRYSSMYRDFEKYT